MQISAGVKDKPPAEAVRRFVASLSDLHVEGHVVRGEAETSDALLSILTKAGSKSVVVAGIPPRYAGAVRSAVAGLKSSFVEDLQGRPSKEALGVLASADAGVTWAVNGLAMEGAMLEVVYDDSFKLASSLPIVHVAMLEASSILSDLSEALPKVGALVKASPGKSKPIVSFISGPSKTGDIEMRLLYGVHGPHTVHAIILDWH